MPWKKGESGNPGGMIRLGNRKLTKALNAALDEKNEVTFEDIADEIVWVAKQRDDLTAKLRAIDLIFTRIEGRPPVQSDDSSHTILQEQFRVLFQGMIHAPRPVAMNGHANGRNSIDLRPADDGDGQNGHDTEV